MKLIYINLKWVCHTFRRVRIIFSILLMFYNHFSKINEWRRFFEAKCSLQSQNKYFKFFQWATKIKLILTNLSGKFQKFSIFSQLTTYYASFVVCTGPVGRIIRNSFVVSWEKIENFLNFPDKFVRMSLIFVAHWKNLKYKFCDCREHFASKNLRHSFIFEKWL